MFLYSTSFASDSTLVITSNFSFFSFSFLFIFNNLQLKFWYMVISDSKDTYYSIIWNKQLTNLKFLEHMNTILGEHKFRHNFQYSLDPFCNCGRYIETTIHFFLYCSYYSNQRKTPFEKSINIKRSLLNQSDSVIVATLFWIEWPQWQRKCMDNRINNQIYYNHRKVHNSIVMNPFKQIITSLETSNWFWITLCHIFLLFSF